MEYENCNTCKHCKPVHCASTEEADGVRTHTIEMNPEGYVCDNPDSEMFGAYVDSPNGLSEKCEHQEPSA